MGDGGDIQWRLRMTPPQVQGKDVEAFLKAVGPVGMAPFLQQFDMGSGDYIHVGKNGSKT